MVDALTELGFFLVAEVLDSGVGIDARSFQNFLCAGSPNPVDIGQCDFNPFVFGQVNAGYTCHVSFILSVCFPQSCSAAVGTGHSPGRLIPPEGAPGDHAGGDEYCAGFGGCGLLSCVPPGREDTGWSVA